MVDALENQCRSRWFLFWRSAKFREDLADAREDIRRFWADVNVSVLSKQNRRVSQSAGSGRGSDEMDRRNKLRQYLKLDVPRQTGILSYISIDGRRRNPNVYSSDTLSFDKVTPGW